MSGRKNYQRQSQLIMVMLEQVIRQPLDLPLPHGAIPHIQRPVLSRNAATSLDVREELCEGYAGLAHPRLQLAPASLTALRRRLERHDTWSYGRPISTNRRRACSSVSDSTCTDDR